MLKIFKRKTAKSSQRLIEIAQKYEKFDEDVLRMIVKGEAENILCKDIRSMALSIIRQGE